MAIRDRGKMKWQGAFFMPEHVKMLGDLRTDYYRTAKPQLDEYQLEEFDERICDAMAANQPIKITVWDAGFTTDIIGKIHYVDPITKQIRIEVGGRKFKYVRFEDIISVFINDQL
jgi:hypothetical protein